MSNVEYFEMIERDYYECTPDIKSSMYMRSIARSLAVIADCMLGIEPADDPGADEVDSKLD